MANQIGVRESEKNGRGASLSFELLGEHVSAERDAALESHGRKIGALPPFGFSPSPQARNEPRYAGAHKTQEAEISADCLYPAPVFWAVWTEMEELNNPGKVVARRRGLDSSDVLNFR